MFYFQLNEIGQFLYSSMSFIDCHRIHINSVPNIANESINFHFVYPALFFHKMESLSSISHLLFQMDQSCCFNPFFFCKNHNSDIRFIIVRSFYFVLKLKFIQFIFHSFSEKILHIKIKHLSYFYCLSMKINHLSNASLIGEMYIQLSYSLP